MRFVYLPVAVAGFLLAASTVPVRGQIESREGIALQNQIYQLRQELKSFQEQQSRGGGSSSPGPVYAPSPSQRASTDLLTQLLTRVDSLEEQVRQLRGRIDETQNQVQRQNADLSKRIDDIAFQINPQGARAAGPQFGTQLPASSPPALSVGQGTPGPSAGQGPPATQLTPPSGPRAAAQLAPRTPELALQDGYSALARRDYTVAEAAAREVLANRASPRAYDARLLLAQALYGQRQFAQAAIAFDDAYSSSRKGSHAQDALLGLAGSLSAINEKKAACDTLARLRSDFPQLRADIATNALVTAQRTGCR